MPKLTPDNSTQQPRLANRILSDRIARSTLAALVTLCNLTCQPSTAAPPLTPKEAEAKTADQMKAYSQKIPGTQATFQMLPIPAGEFLLGSPASEAERKADEGPRLKVKIEPFWMGKHEVTWDEYDVWSFDLDIQRRKLAGIKPTPLDKTADVVTRPTKPYTDMTFGMGHNGYPAICMTQLAAKMYCRWLSAKTGHFYRLPTEAEWEYACRAGTNTAYHFGNDPKQLGNYAWYYDNSEEAYHKIGLKKPNPWGLYDMHGNVSEWVLDAYSAKHYSEFATKTGPFTPLQLLKQSKTLYPRTVRGGSWDDDPETLRAAKRIFSSDEWKMQDPQLPQSIWYHTDALFVGFRIIRPLKIPPETLRRKYGLDAPANIKNQDD